MFTKYKEKPTSVVFRDLMFGSLFMMTAIVFFILYWIHPDAQRKDKEIDPLGKIYVELVWDHKNNVDVDLLIKGPNEETVFFAHPSGELFSIVRDDRGKLFDDSDLNYEQASSRVILDGEYIVNAFVYSESDGILPVEVSITFTIGNRKETRTKILNNRREEITVMKVLVIDGKIVDVSDFQEEIIPEIDFEDE